MRCLSSSKISAKNLRFIIVFWYLSFRYLCKDNVNHWLPSIINILSLSFYHTNTMLVESSIVYLSYTFPWCFAIRSLVPIRIIGYFSTLRCVSTRWNLRFYYASPIYTSNTNFFFYYYYINIAIFYCYIYTSYVLVLEANSKRNISVMTKLHWTLMQRLLKAGVPIETSLIHNWLNLCQTQTELYT